MFYLKKDKSYKTPEGLGKIKTLLTQLNNKRTDFTLPENHTIRITPNWLVEFIEGDGGFYSYVKKTKTEFLVKVTLQISQTAAEKKLMEAIKIYLENLSEGGSKVLISMYERKPNKPSVQLAYVISVQNVTYFNNILIPFFNSLSFHTKKALDYKYWSIIVQICFSGKHLTEQGISLVSDLSSRMNNSRLTTNKNYKLVEISEDRIKYVISSPPVYEYIDGDRYKASGQKVPVRGQVTLIDQEGKEQVFNSLVECGHFLNVDRKRIARYTNKDKLLICNNNKYYVKR